MDRKAGGTLWKHLRVVTKKYRKRYGAYDSRGRLAGKRHIATRPAEVETRARLGHWEGDTVHDSTRHSACIVTMVERKLGFVAIGQLDRCGATETTARLKQLIDAQPHRVRALTLDNGTVFHGYRQLEAMVDTVCYFATPYHAWERGSNENVNGLIRQTPKKGVSIEHLTQRDFQRIADKLNPRPRKRLGFRTPEEVYAEQRSLLHFTVDSTWPRVQTGDISRDACRTRVIVRRHVLFLVIFGKGSTPRP